MSRHVAASNALEECKVGVKPPSTMVLSQDEPNPFKLSIETDLRSHCMTAQNEAQNGATCHQGVVHMSEKS